MKCYNHPIEDAVGACSICGRGLCTQCVHTIDDKLICTKCFTPSKTVEAKLKQYALLSAILGWLGSVNGALIGVYSSLKLFHLGSMRGYQLEIYIVSILTILLTVILLYGSYHLWQTHFKVGGRLNLAAGIGTLSLYGYFTWVIPLLTELGVVGLLLCVPALGSGLLGLMADRFFTNL
jgi:hypothetical protein